MAKTERIFIRVTHEQKTNIVEAAKAHGLTVTDYFLKMFSDSIPNVPATHERVIENTIAENNFYNSLMTNESLPNKAKQIISKELRNYV